MCVCVCMYITGINIVFVLLKLLCGYGCVCVILSFNRYKYSYFKIPYVHISSKKIKYFNINLSVDFHSFYFGRHIFWTVLFNLHS